MISTVLQHTACCSCWPCIDRMISLLRANAYTADCMSARNGQVCHDPLASLQTLTIAYTTALHVIAVQPKPPIDVQNLNSHCVARGQHVARTDSSRNTRIETSRRAATVVSQRQVAVHRWNCWDLNVAQMQLVHSWQVALHSRVVDKAQHSNYRQLELLRCIHREIFRVTFQQSNFGRKLRNCLAFSLPPMISIQDTNAYDVRLLQLYS